MKNLTRDQKIIIIVIVVIVVFFALLFCPLTFALIKSAWQIYHLFKT